MADRILGESFDTVGEWFLPEAPKRKIAGKLCYGPERTELYLNEAFCPLRGAVRAGDAQIYPVIHGITREGKAATLLEAQRTAVSIAFGSGALRQPEKLLSSWLLLGAQVPPDQVYPEVRLRVPGLQVWLSTPTIHQSMGRDETTGSHWLTYRVQGPPKDVTPVSSIESIFTWGVSWGSKSNQFSSIKVDISGWVTIRPESPKELKWYIEQQSKLTAMLAFLAGTAMSPDAITASLDDRHNEIAVLVRLSDTKLCAYDNPHEFYMLRDTMGIDLATAVQNWFEAYSKVRTPANLALSVFGSEGLWLHMQFLSLMQALEGLHRGLLDGEYMSETDFEKTRKLLVDAIPGELSSDHREALRSRIRYGYQYSLRKRLAELAGRLSKPIRSIILGGDGEVPSRWVDTRNYYTHWDEDLRSNLMEAQDLYYANVRMRHFLRALFLDLMGVPQQSILDALRNASHESQQLAHLNSIERRRLDPNDKSGVIMTITESKRDSDG